MHISPLFFRISRKYLCTNRSIYVELNNITNLLSLLESTQYVEINFLKFCICQLIIFNANGNGWITIRMQSFYYLNVFAACFSWSTWIFNLVFSQWNSTGFDNNFVFYNTIKKIRNTAGGSQNEYFLLYDFTFKSIGRLEFLGNWTTLCQS